MKERTEEILSAMKSFGKDNYMKRELLQEMFSLQKEIVDLTFNGEHASTANLRIWDVERHLEQMNRDCDNVADNELQAFKNGSKTLCNLIKAEVSGARGEAKAFRVLQNLKKRNIILKNVELSDGDFRTELDAVVIMPKAIVIVEVKNTARNIFIDEDGNYFRTGEYLKWDCNIANKMMAKETLLCKALELSGVKKKQIKSIVVFTDSRIEVRNKYSYIKTCFLSQLADLIDELDNDSSQLMTDDEMTQVEHAIMAAENKESYPFEFDVKQYKRNFATLMATLEEASTKKETDAQKEVSENKKLNKWSLVKGFLKSKYTEYVDSAAAAAAVTLVSTVVFNTIRKGGIFR